MRLTSLELTNFRSFRDVALPIDGPKVLIAGLNGTGKTSIVNAIRWLLTNRCDGTDGRGAGAEVLIPTGQKGAEVAATIAGIGKVRRTFMEQGGGSFSVDGFTGTSAVQDAALRDKLKTLPEVLAAVLDTHLFLNLNHVEGKAMVLSLLGVRIPFGEKSLTLDELDVLYKQAFEDRKVAKRVFQQFQLLTKPVPQQMPTLAQIEEQLTKLRTAQGDLQRATGETRGKRTAYGEELARLEKIIGQEITADQSERILTLQFRLAEIPEPAETAPSALSAEAQKQVKDLRSRLEAIQRHKPKAGCVLGSDIPCKTPQSAFGVAERTLSDEILKLRPRDAPAPTEDQRSPIERELNDMHERQAHRLAQMNAVADATFRREAVLVDVTKLADTSVQDSELVNLGTRISKGEQLLRDARSYFASIEAYEQEEKRGLWLKAEVDRLEKLVEQLGPNGLRVQALKEAMGRFQAAVNPYLQAFGWTIAFHVEPWAVAVNGRLVETYSRSERFRIGIALQMGIAQLSGLNFAVIDEMDMLDIGNRAIVTKMLLQAPLEQVIILGTREDNMALPAIPGLIAYRLGRNTERSIVIEAIPA